MGAIECMQTPLGTLFIILFVYSILTTSIIILLIWILKNQFNKGEKNENN